MYVIEYINSLFMVGFYKPNGEFIIYSDFDNKDVASDFCNYLNGGNNLPAKKYVIINDKESYQEKVGLNSITRWKDRTRKARFHTWGCNFEEFDTGVGNFSVGICEFEDGHIESIPVDYITFI